MKYIHALLVFILAMIVPAMGQEAAEGKVLLENDYLVQIMAGVVMALKVLFTWVGGLIVARMRKAGIQESVIDEISALATKQYHNGVKQAKAAAADGKLTEVEAKQFRDNLWDDLLVTLKGPALRYAKSKKNWAMGKLEDVINAKRGK
jgi:hypothetical protein